MKSKKSRSKSKGKGKATGKRGIKDLPASDARAKNTRGGGTFLSSATSEVIKNIGSALQTGARGG